LGQGWVYPEEKNPCYQWGQNLGPLGLHSSALTTWPPSIPKVIEYYTKIALAWLWMTPFLPTVSYRHVHRGQWRSEAEGISGFGEILLAAVVLSVLGCVLLQAE